jgi:hypothetical protein
MVNCHLLQLTTALVTIVLMALTHINSKGICIVIC